MTSQHDEWRELGQQLRVDSVRSSSAAGSGHPTSSMSAADLMAVLMSKYLHYDFGTPDDPRNDHLIFSKGHASPLLYAMYKAAGAISDDEMLTFRRFGVAHRGPSDAGPAVGRRRHRLARPGPADQRRRGAGRQAAGSARRTGSGACAATPRWPRARCGRPSSTPGFHGLDNLTAIIDVNRLGQTGETMHGWDLDAYRRRAEAFGWKAIEIDGHDVAAIDRALATAVETTGQPTVIIARTEKGHGVKAVADLPGKHGKPLDDPDAAIAELGGIPRPPRRCRQARDHAAQPHVFPTTALTLPSYEPGTKEATRKAFGDALRRARQGTRRCRRARRRGRQQHLHRGVRRSAAGSVLPGLHRRAADGRPPRSGSRCAAGSRSPRRSPRS